jgi:hypothetical protein
MKYLRYTLFLTFSLLAFFSLSQCSFQYISNDTVFQDYIEFVYSKKKSDEIIAIGSRINRGLINDSVFNAPVFQIFDYCGNLRNRTIYNYIGIYKLKHEQMSTHNTYKEEPIGNRAININEDEFLLVDKAFDTLLKKQVMILFIINENGEPRKYQTMGLSIQEANDNIIKNVLQLKDGKILVILWNNAYGYFFYYFDKNLDFIYKKTFDLGRGIRSIKEVDNGEFICTSLAYDKTSFQFYRLDTTGEIRWMITPYKVLGSAREILLENNKMYITGGVGGFGVFLICDMNGNILKEFKYDTFYCQQRFCSAYVNSDNSYIIGGYIQHCESIDKRGSDVAIIKIDTNGTILWNKIYDFRNALGTSGEGGYYTDYGGFMIDKTNDGGIILNGLSQYRGLSSEVVLHEDALLIKTEPVLVTNANKQININILQFDLSANLINNYLNINGPVNLIKDWVVYSLQGEVILYGNEWSGQVNINNIEAGMYTIRIMDRNNYKYFLKFIKI